MIRIIDTYEQINSLFIDGEFCFHEWETEQRLVGDSDYYHQDKNGWRNWCEDIFFRYW